jgi:hypothetical protein
MKVQPKHMTAYVELEITDYKTFEQLVEDWSEVNLKTVPWV